MQPGHLIGSTRAMAGRLLAEHLRSDRLPVRGRPKNWAPAFEYWLTSYRRVWRGSIASGFLVPLLYLGALGYGLGKLVDNGGSGRLDGVPYVAFVAPGILAASAMQTAVGEATYPVLAARKWQGQYLAQLASPLTTTDIFAGHLAFIGFRLVIGAAAFLIVGALLHAFVSWWAVLALVAAVLCGLAHAAPVMAYSIRQDSDSAFILLFRFIVVPLFLFAGTFFPVDQMPLGLQIVAWLTPLWHGTALCRDLALGSVQLLPVIGHLAYLSVWIVVGVLIAVRSYGSRLEA
jgi:lipooligosaccharide transport system permease protein